MWGGVLLPWMAVQWFCFSTLLRWIDSFGRVLDPDPHVPWCVVWFAALGSVTPCVVVKDGSTCSFVLACCVLGRLQTLDQLSTLKPINLLWVRSIDRGLRNKAHYFHTHMSYGDIWTAAETHFYGKDVSRFRAGLRASHSAHKYCITDAPSTRRQVTSQSAWKGVGVLAKHPTRALPSSLQNTSVNQAVHCFHKLVGRHLALWCRGVWPNPMHIITQLF